jgi:hypothetical protein
MAARNFSRLRDVCKSSTVSRRTLLAVALLAALPGLAVAGQRIAVTFQSRPVLVKTSDGAVAHLVLDRPARRPVVWIAGRRATVYQTGGRTAGAYDAFVTHRRLRPGRTYRVWIRVISRSGGVTVRDEALYLHRRWPRRRG